MLRRDRQLWTQIFQLKDAALFCLALWLAYLVRENLHLDRLVGWMPFVGPQWQSVLQQPIEPFEKLVWLYLIIFPGVPLVLESQGFYNRPLNGSRRTTAWLLFKSCLIVTVGVIAVMYLFKISPARGVIVLFGFISFVLVFLKEELLRHGYRSRLGQIQFKKTVILVGAVADTVRMRADLREKSAEGIEIVAELDLNESSIERFVAMLHELSPNSVVLNARHTYFGQIEKAIQACEIEGVEAWLVADFFQTQVSRTTLDDFYGRPVLVFRSAPEVSWQIVIKQVLDVTIALAMLIVLGIPLALVALLIKFTSPGPVLFRQQRAGLNGRPFSMLKFRSMVSNAEQLKQELAALNEMSGPVFKVTNDPRITPLGRLLRKTSIDELPQLFNVLRGEMSLVGPRPLPVDEVQRFDDPAHRRRLSMRPGLTCLWQVSGRNKVKDFKDWVRLDLAYIDNWSLWLDVKILCRTVPVVLSCSGAK